MALLLFMAVSGCQKEETASSTQRVLEKKAPMLAANSDMPELGDNRSETDCQCSYRIISVNGTPYNQNNTSGGPNYYLYGGVITYTPSGDEHLFGCSGIFDNCTLVDAFDFSAYGSTSSTGCWCYDPNVTDFIYDDQNQLNGSPYPTAVYPFECSTPLYSDIKVVWQAGWNNATCTNNTNWCAPGSTIKFKIFCADSFELPEDCSYEQPLGHSSPEITLTVGDNITIDPSVKVYLEGCGCTPSLFSTRN